MFKNLIFLVGQQKQKVFKNLFYFMYYYVSESPNLWSLSDGGPQRAGEPGDQRQEQD